MVGLKDPSGNEFRFYGSEVVEGYERPSLFIQMTPLSFERYSKTYTRSKILFTITFIQKELSEEENLRIADCLKKMCMEKLLVKERYLDLTNYSIGYIGEKRNILQISMETEFLDQIERKETEPQISNVQINREME